MAPRDGTGWLTMQSDCGTSLRTKLIEGAAKSAEPQRLGVAAANSCNRADRRSAFGGSIRIDACYFVTIRLGVALGVCSAGEMTKVTQAFQPSGRSRPANSQ